MSKPQANPMPSEKPDAAPKASMEDIELSGIRYPELVHGKGYSSIMVGQDYSSGVTLSGIIKQITLLGNSGGIVRVRVRVGSDKIKTVLILPTGAAAETVE